MSRELVERYPSSAGSKWTSATPTPSTAPSPPRAAGSSSSIHAAAQPSHDWAARDPQTDFGVNANGTLNLLEATRRFAPDATFIFCSTNKVYGDTPNRLPLEELETRLELPGRSPLVTRASTRRMSIDRSTHSLFGVSKAAADLLVQEYGRYFDMPTVCFRGGCLTGPASRRRACCTASSPT